MTFISCARLDDVLPVFSRLPHLGMEKKACQYRQNLQIFCNTLRIFCNTCRFSAIAADFLQHSADFLQDLQIFCKTCRFSVTLCGFSAIPADFLQYPQIFCNTCGFSAIPADFLQYLRIFCNTYGFSAMHWARRGRGGGRSGLKMQFFPVFYHKIGILLSKYFEEHKIIQKYICIIANHHFLSQ